mmetsp:Transcript_66039/g.137936  ORF Transcript_66039/g.137936 Transcript_66039/m.137936 type:complete len:548 (-) Transcript_66039:106-1749(-)|eukprot:CAMPEP_0206424760 /NCGR_PEP_ID=MMETSP0324_2-20121206/3413_1 /ASSEMBLY_ACC=CAM_ASM_000836 /TAXON_ID=2866 /ORGANISM="Crypthecodinium cohnii, Strain Seligo" /LENGTH=547 /DNA_ID=CAMNT_0053889463 /DNA_START=44 /DNA_END=1687 /DNA_ORIENTATION=+
MADRFKSCFRDDGSYDFKRREDWDYKHNYNYMAGWLGQEEADAARKKRRKMGTVDLPAPPLPQDIGLVETIEKTAKHIHSSADATVFERLIQDKNKGKAGWEFLNEGGLGNDYYIFVRHCLERKVEPRPLAEQARKVKEDREKKEQNVKNNVFTATSGEPAMASKPKEAVYKCGELMEVLGIKAKPDYNGKIVKVLKYHPDVDRYEVRFEGGRYDSVVVKLKEDNLMYSAVETKDVDANKEMPEGEIPNGVKVEIRNLQSEAARWMNGQKGIIVQWDKMGERYEVRLDVDNTIKKVKPGNIKVELPEGWEEHYDEHISRFYYLNLKTQKVTWKHPTVVNHRAKFNKVMQHNAEEMDDADVDENRKTYDVDDEEENEGEFNLQMLVKKVEAKEEKRLEAEEKGEEYEDSDDGMHEVAKKRGKKKKKLNLTVEQLQERVAVLIQNTMANRATMKKDYTLLDGNFITKDIDPLIADYEKDPAGASDVLRRSLYETVLGLLEKGTSLMGQLKVAKLQLVETNKRLDLLADPDKPEELLEVAKWTAALLKTM